MKLFERLGVPDEKPLFLALLFCFAAFSVGVALLIRRARMTLIDFTWGIVLGVPNLFASYFLVSALRELPAYVVFPTVSAGTVMLITIIAIFIFHERLKLLGFAGICLTLASIVALNM
jgi:multidrug transporter EmrE-like cation transporter